jgi:hypothetical protein
MIPSTLHNATTAVALSIGFASGCGPVEDDTYPAGPPCVEVPQGVRYELTLLEVYNASSSYYHDPPLGGNQDNCAASDSLDLGSTVAFTTGRYAPRKYHDGCSYREMTDVEGVDIHPGQYTDFPGGLEGISIAGWHRSAIIDSERVGYSLVLLAPTGDPTSPLVEGELPGAVLNRLEGLCRASWVVEVEEGALR